MRKKIIGIKLGSATLVKGGKIDKRFIQHVCEQIASLVKNERRVFLVTSGAIASDQTETRSKNLRSAIGQPRIMEAYLKFLGQLGIEGAQFLLTDEQLVDKKSAKTKLTKTIMHEALAAGVVPIINANDVIDNEEIKALKHCADNDKLFKLMCLLIGADIAIVGLDQSGFLDSSGNVMQRIDIAEIDSVLEFARGGNSLGHGSDGMKTKILSLAELAQTGMRVHLAPAKEKNFILRSVAGEKDFGTVFVR